MEGGGDPVGGGGQEGLVRVADTADDDGAESPEELEDLGGRGAQTHGDDFGAVGG